MELSLLTRRAAMLLMFLGAAASAADLGASVRDSAGKPVADAVIIARPVDVKNLVRPTVPGQAVDQVDKQFVPYVKAVFVGTQIQFPNSDKVRHQVYSFSAAKKFELPLYAGRDAPPVSFDTPGVVVLGCNIHDWMIGYVYVSDSPYFAVTETNGKTRLRDLPAGRYEVSVWHPGLKGSEQSTRQVLTLGSTDGELEWQLAVRQTPRVARVSGAAGASYP